MSGAAQLVVHKAQTNL